MGELQRNIKMLAFGEALRPHSRFDSDLILLPANYILGGISWKLEYSLPPTGKTHVEFCAPDFSLAQ